MRTNHRTIFFTHSAFFLPVASSPFVFLPFRPPCFANKFFSIVELLVIYNLLFSLRCARVVARK